MTKPERMTIGEFARKTRLSSKALRLYDSMGLLTPDFIDPDSGYRYYRNEQVERARLIGLLRQLEMPLDRISQVLDLDSPQAVRAVGSYWREVESDLKVKRQLVRYLEDYLAGKENEMYEVSERQVPEQKVISIQGRVYAKELPAFIRESMGRLIDYVRESGLEQSAAPFVAYHGQVDVDSDGPVETCVVFEGNLEPRDEMRVRMEPSHHEAFTRLNKSQIEFPGILEAYDAVKGHLARQGKEDSGSPREVYFADWAEVGDDDPVCDIAFPYRI